MKLPLFIATIFLARLKATNGDENTSPSTSSSTGGDVIKTPTYAQSMEDAIKEMIQDFSHMTSLHESLVQHPFFSHGSDDIKSSSGSKPFSTWGSFGALTRWSPRYEVIDDDKSFQVKLDVPGFHYHEMDVRLDAGGRVLTISGNKESNVHETSQDDKEKKAGERDDKEDREGNFEFTSHSSTSFQQRFTLDPSIDTSHMTANLVNGVLEVRAPRKHGSWNKKHIPITQFDSDVFEKLMAANENGDMPTVAEE